MILKLRQAKMNQKIRHQPRQKQQVKSQSHKQQIRKTKVGLVILMKN
jgi:hypothetical protein